MMATTTIHNTASASILGHRLFHSGALPLPDDPLSDRNSDVVAGVCAPASWPWSDRSSGASSGVCSVVRLDWWDRADGDERADWWEAGRELGVRVEPHVSSGVSMAVRIQRNGEDAKS